ncbi:MULTISPECIES: endolytic transglycosylase MltG [Fictibacillus]|uniref:endolytic transglycosylase MltG n=1 Tax=Fictibacillus TaxID=1329200 RepID=UPI0011A8B650|nr:endolytic transglycosylase MltG [Fictibacillus phosphorivorans]
MTSKNLRGFSAGIILSTGILAGFYYTADDADKTSELTEESVAQYLSEKGELAISKEEYTSLKDTETAAAPVAKEEPKTVPPKEEDKVYQMTLTITQGMSTGEVCDLLQKENIIKNSDEFLKYLRTNNLEGAVRAESHQVNSKMSFDEIAKEITSS